MAERKRGMVYWGIFLFKRRYKRNESVFFLKKGFGLISWLFVRRFVCWMMREESTGEPCSKKRTREGMEKKERQGGVCVCVGV